MRIFCVREDFYETFQLPSSPLFYISDWFVEFFPNSITEWTCFDVIVLLLWLTESIRLYPLIKHS